MKEVEKNEIKRLSDRLDAIRHQQAELSLVEAADKYAELEKEKATLETEIERLRSVQSQKLSKEAQKLMSLPFRRAITKKEQADMGKRPRPGGRPSDDRPGPGNGSERDDRFRPQRILIPSPLRPERVILTYRHPFSSPAGRLVQPINSSTPQQFTNPSKCITNPLPKSNIWLTIRCHQPCYP